MRSTRYEILYTTFDQVPGPKGAATHVEAFVRALGAGQGHVTLVTPGARDQSRPSLFPNVDHVVLGCPDLNPIGRARTFRAKLVAWLGEKRFDVIHFRSIFEGFPFLNPEVRRQARLIYEVNGLPSIELKYHYPRIASDMALLSKLERQENACLRAAERIITVSDVNASYLRQRGVAPEKIHVIRNGVHRDEFPYRPRESVTREHGHSESLQVAYVGTMASWQGIETLLAAVAMARRQRSITLHLMVTGPKQRQREIQQRVEQLQLSDTVVLHAPGSRADVARLYHQVDLSAVPLEAVDRNLLQGCCPLKLLESMAAGCPVLASDLPVVNEVAKASVHYCAVTAGDVSAWAEALVQWDTNLHRERWGDVATMTCNAHQIIAAQFTWQQATDSLLQLYRLAD